MDTYNFATGQRIQRFPLALSVEVRLCYQFMHPFQGNWEELQERFRTQFSMIGCTREHLFYAWRSIYFDENAKIIDAYVQRIWQVAACLIVVNHTFWKCLKDYALMFALDIIPN